MRINAQFGSCKKCGVKFARQELIEWQKDVGSWHIRCMPDDSIPEAVDLLDAHALADRLGFDNPPTPIPGAKVTPFREPKKKPISKQRKLDL